MLASKQRSLLALIGILIGASSVIAMLNVGGMAQNETAKLFEQMGTDIVSIRNSASYGFRPADIALVTTSSPGLSTIAPFSSASADAMYQSKTFSPQIVGASQAFSDIGRIRVKSGRFVSDLDRFELFVVVGDQVAQMTGVKVGSDMRVGRYQLRVIGILGPVATNPMVSVDLNNALFVSMANARRITPSAAINTILGRVSPGFDVGDVAARIADVANRGGRSSTIDVQTAQQLITGMASQKRLLQVLLGVIGGIALVLGGVGVMNIMLVSVQERQREIGIRLAIGARRRDIQTLFLSEAIILALLGGGLGAVVGIAASYGFALFSSWDFVITPWAAPLGAGVSIAVGMFFGFYPAVIASRLDPVIALRAD